MQGVHICFAARARDYALQDSRPHKQGLMAEASRLRGPICLEALL